MSHLDIARHKMLRHVCPQLSWHDVPVGKQSRLRDTGGGVISVVDWSEEPSTGGERKSASFGESCRSKLWSSWETWRKSWGPPQCFYRKITHENVFEPFVILVVSWIVFSISV